MQLLGGTSWTNSGLTGCHNSHTQQTIALSNETTHQERNWGLKVPPRFNSTALKPVWITINCLCLTCPSSNGGSTVHRGPLCRLWCAPWAESKVRQVNTARRHTRSDLDASDLPCSESQHWWCQDCDWFCEHWWTQSAAEYWCPADKHLHEADVW